MPTVVLDGRYRVDGLIGSGGFAQVFAGTDLERERSIAIKIMRVRWRGDRRVIAQFRNEASALRRLSDAPAARLLGTGETDDHRHYLVLDLLSGSLFGELLEVALTLDQLLTPFLGMLDALVAIHERGIVHGDLKASNVFVTDTHRPAAVLIDFGLAAIVNAPPRHSRHNDTVGGTPEFMAPELTRGRRRTVASDVYAAGAMLYELITGGPPFRGSCTELAARHELEGVPPPSASAQVHVPPALDAIVLRAMAKRPVDRFPTVSAMRAALLEFARTSTSLGDVRPACEANEKVPTWRHGRPIPDSEDVITRDLS